MNKQSTARELAERTEDAHLDELINNLVKAAQEAAQRDGTPREDRLLEAATDDLHEYIAVLRTPRTELQHHDTTRLAKMLFARIALGDHVDALVNTDAMWDTLSPHARSKYEIAAIDVLRAILPQQRGTASLYCSNCGEAHLLEGFADELVRATAVWLERFTREPNEEPSDASSDGPWWVNARCLLSHINGSPRRSETHERGDE